MKNRFYRMGTTLLYAVCLLSTCGITSCSDDYDLVDTKPSFLGESIYDELKKNGSFTTELRLIDDLAYADVLAKTGSKTLFVANDDAFNAFFQTTNWKDGADNPIRSYEQLSTNQKRLLLNGSMLNNAYVMEMLANTSGGAAGKNLCLRRVSSASVTDSITEWKLSELPVNLFEPDEATGVDNTDVNQKDFWATLRNSGDRRSVLYMAVDKTDPMLTHFLEGQLNEKKIKHDDIAFVLNLPEGSWAEGADGGENRSYIYNRRVVSQDVVCLNGYYHVLDSVLITPPSMAEVIRTNGSTELFSKMLDRFSAPYYDASLTRNYGALHDIKGDSVFQKRYISTNNQDGAALTVDMNGRSIGDEFPSLPFDPAWNQYAISSSTTKENDMAAMFVPSDEAMKNYFLSGGGVVLMERYAKAKPVTEENLLYNLYQIPLNVLSSLINNLMKDSFNETVPSKYLTIMNDAQDQMFPADNYSNVSAYKSLFDKVLLANNGVVYVMNTVISPADYASVAAPALLSSNTQIISSVVQADDKYIQGSGYANAPLKQYFNTYLKAMQSTFTFFVPTDEGLRKYGYVDPVSLSSGLPLRYRYWSFEYAPSNATTTGKRLPIKATPYKYDPSKARDADVDDRDRNTSISEAREDLTSGYGPTKRELLIEMVNQHIVIHDNNDTEGVAANRQYFTARSGAPVITLSKGNAANDHVGMQVVGGMQVNLNNDEYDENNEVCTVVEGYNMTRERNGYGNGMTYFLDRAMQPTMTSTYTTLSTNANFEKFFSLCDPAKFDEDLLKKAGFEDNIPEKNHSTLWQAEKNKYTIFTRSNGYIAGKGDYLVRFMNNYRYTLYVPTNDAVDKAIAQGLPTWETIETYYNEHKDENDLLSDDDKAVMQAMIICLTNFIKYHFQDDAYYIDNVTATHPSCQTACIEHVNEYLDAYIYVDVEQAPNKITVKDNSKASYSVIAPYNILSREMNFDRDPTQIATARYVKNSSYVAIHQLDGYLNFIGEGGRFDKSWNTPSSARKFAAKYRIRK